MYIRKNEKRSCLECVEIKYERGRQTELRPVTIQISFTITNGLSSDISCWSKDKDRRS